MTVLVVPSAERRVRIVSLPLGVALTDGCAGHELHVVLLQVGDNLLPDAVDDRRIHRQFVAVDKDNLLLAALGVLESKLARCF